MNTAVIFAFVALTTTALALIHESRLRRAAHNVLDRLVQSHRHKQDQTRNGSSE
jgi:hypothetical protein